jgi:hypothetical protein
MIKGLAIVAAMLAFTLPAFAQNQEDPAEQRARRLREQLQLNDEQAAKARDIYKKQYDDIKGILTEEQKKRYEDSLRGGSSGRGGNPPQGGGSRSGFLPGTDELKTQLSLTDEQVTKITTLRDASRDKFRQLFQGGGRGGNTQEAITKLRDELNGQIREVLTDAQKPKFDEIVKAAQAGAASSSNRGGSGRGNPVDERVNRAMERLRIENATEAEAIKGLVRKVVEIMEKLDDHQRDGRRKLEEVSRNADLSDQAVGERLEEVIKGQREIEKELASARKDLTEVVTNRQEVELLRSGILR